MAEEFAAHGVRFVFVYTREAHPGEKYPAHTRIEQKLSHARDMVARWGMKRPMLVDDLEGTLHHAYGRLPNMTYIVQPSGKILYRASWTDPRTIRMALEQLIFERGERRARKRMTPYYLEWMPLREADQRSFMEGLLRVGPRAVEEYIAATADFSGEAAARPLREWWEREKAGDGSGAER